MLLDELGVNGTTPIILKRALLLIEVAFPLAVVTMFLHGLEVMQSLEIPSYKMFLDFEYAFISGLVVLLIHDYLKRYFIKKNAIMNHILFEEKVEKKKRKKLFQGVAFIDEVYIMGYYYCWFSICWYGKYHKF